MSKFQFTVKELQDYISVEIAYFCRDNMFELNDAPMDYDDHFDYIVNLYYKYLEERGRE